jgi:phage shock protein A
MLAELQEGWHVMGVDPQKIVEHTVEKAEPIVDPIRDHEGRIVRNEERLTQQAEAVQREMASLETRLTEAISEGNRQAVEGLSNRLTALESKLADTLVAIEELRPKKAAQDVTETPETVVEPVERQETSTPPKKEEHHGYVGRRKARLEARRNR